jgi:6-phosphogluconolactonase/glucosamine-6-phosphate isomerase/deaminase
MRQITVVEDPGAAVAERLTAAAEQGAHIVLTGGSTPRGAYAIAAEQGAE